MNILVPLVVRSHTFVHCQDFSRVCLCVVRTDPEFRVIVRGNIEDVITGLRSLRRNNYVMSIKYWNLDFICSNLPANNTDKAHSRSMKTQKPSTLITDVSSNVISELYKDWNDTSIRPVV